MNNYKERFIALLNEREKLIEEQTSYSQKVREMGKVIDSNKDEIDLVFAEMLRDDYDLYQQLSEPGKNMVCAKFERDNNLVEIYRYMMYDKPVDRIRIDMSKML
ncbi:hypothetical protein [Phocaeicola sp.]